MTQITQSQQRVSEWLHHVIETYRDPETGASVSMTRLSELARVAPSTLSRNLNPKPEYTSEMTPKTIRKIVMATGMAPPSGLGIDIGGEARVYQAPDVEQLELPDPATPMTQEPEPPCTVWIVRSRALQLAGYMPGDILIVDPFVTPRNGDAVFAQVYAIERGTRATVLREYQQAAPGSPAFLNARTADPGIDAQTLLVDGERVAVTGTVIHLHRNRRGDA